MNYLKHHNSAEIPTPKGWTARYFIIEHSGELWKEVADKDGFIWIAVDGKWELHVPAFGSGGFAGQACLQHAEHGAVYCLHNENTGIISIGNRKIKPENWIH
jgi:hypothetical protein